MIKRIIPIKNTREYCEHCKSECKGIREGYILESSNDPNLKMLLCNCCMDIALNEQGILPEDF